MGHAELQPEDIDESISPLYASIKRTWSDFCGTTSIHGLKFTRDDHTNRYIRFFWLVLTLVMFLCAIVMVIRFYKDYRSNPTRMNVENDHSPITNVYFPSITVCPDVLYNMEKSKEFIESLVIPRNATVKEVLNNLNILHGFQVDETVYPTEVVQLMESVLVINNITLEDFVGKVQWSCDDFFFRCRYLGAIVDCGDLFKKAYSFKGHCCAFNIIQPGLNFTARLSNGGLYSGLSLILYHKDSLYDPRRAYSNGFDFLIGENSAYPSAHSIAKFAPLNQETFISLQTVEVLCSKAVMNLDWEERMCVMPDEYELRYFDDLSNGHCELNCRSTNMVKYCGCNTYFLAMNRKLDPVCSFKDIPCLVENFTQIIGRFRNTQCSCPMRCERIDFAAQSMLSDLVLDAPTVDSFYDGLRENFAVAHIYHESQVYRRITRDLLSNMVTLVSNLGSAFSLFVGMSMVSVVEILYYFTVILQKHYQQEVKAREKIRLNNTTKVE